MADYQPRKVKNENGLLDWLARTRRNYGRHEQTQSLEGNVDHQVAYGTDCCLENSLNSKVEDSSQSYVR